MFIAFSQKKATFSIQFNDVLLSDALTSVEKIYSIHFSYRDDLIKNKRITLINKNRTLQNVLFLFEKKYQIKFQKIDETNYVILKRTKTLKDIQHLNNVIINNYLTTGIYKRKNTSFQLKTNNLAILPGLIETDIIESIQQLPGVISPNETATGLIVRGGSNDQNRIIWDGINSYHKGHLFGMVSSFNPNMSSKVTFYNKGTNPKFGERISSVINIETNNKINEKLQASFDLNGISASFFLAIPIIDKKLNVQIATRRSYAELYKSITFDKLAKKVFQNTKIQNIENTNNDFFFSDYNLKINFKPNDNNQFYFSLFNIENNLDYTVDNIENNEEFNDILTIKNEGYSLRWNKKWSKNVKQITLGSFSNYKFNYNFIRRQNEEKIIDFDKINTIYDTSIKTEIQITTSKTDKLSIGYQYNFKDVSYAFLETSDLPLVLDNSQTIVSTHSLYANFAYYEHKLFDFEGGFRVNYFSELNEIKFEPRLIIHKQVLKNIEIQVTAEIKNQIISQIDETILSDLSLENEVWRLSDNENYPIINSSQISAGLIYKNKGWSLDLDFYKKYTKGLSALSLGFLNPTDNAVHLGNRKIKGIDFYVKKDINNLKVWLSYSFNDVKNKFENLNNKKYFTANNAIAHSGSIAFGYNLKKVEMVLGFKARTGKPFTKSFLQDNERIFNEINTGELEFYHRLDFSSTYQFMFDKKNKVKGKIGLSVRNIYDKSNQISREYIGNNSLNDPIRIVDKFSLRFTPNFLFKIYW
ncbi:MAG: hypothetical protein L3J23_02520 [Flavobacteriaceae bacterium]|nr:hypothetical protein [Flavobacteriaceae bacterium]